LSEESTFPSDAASLPLAITSLQPGNDATNLYYTVNYSGKPSRLQLFLDTDRNAGTGYPINGIGASHLVEIGAGYRNLYTYSGAGGAWGWTLLKSVTYTVAAGTVNITIARSDVGSPNGIDVIAGLANSTATVYSAKVPQELSSSSPDTVAPSVPAGLTGTAVSGSQINLSWTASTDNVGVTGYIIYLNDAQLATTTGTSFSHTGLTAGTTYNYRVSAFDAVPNHSAWSAPVAVTTPAVPALAVTSLQAGNDATNLYYTINFTGAPSRVQLFLDTDRNAGTGYPTNGIGASHLVEISAGNGSLYSYSGSGGTWAWTFVRTVTHTIAGGAANITIARTDVGSPGGIDLIAVIADLTATVYSAKVSQVLGVGPDTTAPSVPTGLIGTAVSGSQINLSWIASTDNVGVTGYYVYLNDVALATTTSTSFQHTGLASGTTYNYRVSAYDAVPNHSAWTATPVSVTTGAPAPGTVQSATFTSTTAEIPNPERGLAKMYTDLTGVYPAWLTSLHDAGYRMVTHRQLLNAYVNTPTLPQSFLDALNAGAARHRAAGTKMAMQFSYDNAGGGPEPSLTTILGHIAQLKPFFTANADVIAAVHGGFLGTYGEWAFSTHPTVGNPTPTPAARRAVRDALLAAVDPSTPIGFRVLDDLSTWFPTPITIAQAFTGTPQARSGIHNDCFLRNADDAGTYWRAGSPDNGRTLSNPLRAYHAQASDFTTTGGENCGDGQYKACADVLYDGPTYHWRYLRDDWGTVFHDGWKAQGCYPEIKRSLGYRFQLDAIAHARSAAPGGSLNVEVDLRNVGWARILSARQLVVTLKHRTSGALLSGGAGDMRLVPSRGSASTRIVVPVAIPAAAEYGDYDVYLSMPDIWPGTKSKADFAVRFANADDLAKGQAWEPANFRFKAGTTVTLAN
jgi:chitodextrinase